MRLAFSRICCSVLVASSVAIGGGAQIVAAAPGADGTWSLLSGLTVTRQDHAAVFDAEGDRMIVFGGTLLTNFGAGAQLFPLAATDDLVEIGFSGAPAWRAIATTGERPAARSSHTLVFDRFRRTAILFGGAGSAGVFGDVWRLDLAGTPAWSRVTPAGPAPASRWGHSAIYDLVGDRMIIFGGFDANATLLGDVWALDLSGSMQWTEFHPSGPGPGARGNHVAIYDSRGGRMIVEGGYDTFGRNDVWSLPLASPDTWSQLFPQGNRPAQAGEHAAIFDSTRNEMVLVGQLSNLAPSPSVFHLSLGATPTWTSVAASGAIPVVFDRQSLIIDPVRNRMVLFGGPSASFWTQALAGGSWSAIPLANALPSSRASNDVPVAILDAKRHRVLFALTNRFDESLQFWSLDLGAEPSWTQVLTTGATPTQRLWSSLCIDTRRDRLIMYGGKSDFVSAISSQVWTLDLVTQQWTVASPPGPAGRFGHSAVYDSLDDRMIVFGGLKTQLGGPYVNELWSYAPGAGAWSPLIAVPTAPARSYHGAVLDPIRRRMVVHGGLGFDRVNMDDVWTLSLDASPTWSPMSTFGLTPQHWSHQLAYDADRDRMIAYGPFGAEPLHSGAVYALSFAPQPAWRRLLSSGIEPHPSTVAAIYDVAGDRLVAAGRTTFTLDFGGVPAPSLALTGSDARAERVVFRFLAGDAHGMSVALWRRAAASNEPWVEVGTSPVEGGLAVVADPNPTPGAAYVYRPGLRDEGGEQPFGVVRIEVPGVTSASIASLWPNPAGRVLWARIRLPAAGDVHVELLDLQGRRVYTDAWQVRVSGVFERRFDLPADLAPGVYLLRMFSGPANDAKRIIVLE